MTKVEVNKRMDLGMVVAILMLIVWAVLTFIVNDAPGVTHALLIAGVTLVIWRVVKRDALPARERPRQP
jgi:hypothetical protein